MVFVCGWCLKLYLGFLFRRKAAIPPGRPRDLQEFRVSVELEDLRGERVRHRLAHDQTLREQDPGPEQECVELVHHFLWGRVHGIRPHHAQTMLPGQVGHHAREHHAAVREEGTEVVLGGSPVVPAVLRSRREKFKQRPRSQARASVWFMTAGHPLCRPTHMLEDRLSTRLLRLVERGATSSRILKQAAHTLKRFLVRQQHFLDQRYIRLTLVRVLDDQLHRVGRVPQVDHILTYGFQRAPAHYLVGSVVLRIEAYLVRDGLEIAVLASSLAQSVNDYPRLCWARPVIIPEAMGLQEAVSGPGGAAARKHRLDSAQTTFLIAPRQAPQDHARQD